MSLSSDRWFRRVIPASDGDEESTASAIYGVIVSAAVMAASHADRIVAVGIAVLFTLVVYWSAERYARLVAARIHDGHRPTWRQARHELTHGWPMVTASAVPLVVLLVAAVSGAQVYAAVIAALVASTVLLGLAGWEIGRHGRLSTRERWVSAGVAALFGVAMILLKALLH